MSHFFFLAFSICDEMWCTLPRPALLSSKPLSSPHTPFSACALKIRLSQAMFWLGGEKCASMAIFNQLLCPAKLTKADGGHYRMANLLNLLYILLQLESPAWKFPLFLTPMTILAWLCKTQKLLVSQIHMEINKLTDKATLCLPSDGIDYCNFLNEPIKIKLKKTQIVWTLRADLIQT